MSRNFIAFFLRLLAPCLVCNIAYAATDAGIVQEYQEPGNLINLDSKTTPPPVAPARQQSNNSTKIKVSQFSIEGASLFSGDRLQALLQGYQGRELSLQDLYDAAAQISNFYHENGYPLASTFIPPQEIHDGLVKLIVVEGKYGDIRITGSERLQESTIGQILNEQGMVSGNPIEQQSLERGLLILQSMPGTDATISFRGGKAESTSDVEIEAKPKHLITGYLSADNHTSRYIGAQRATASVFLNSPFGWGDQATLRGTHAVDHDFMSADYSFPIGSNGLRLAGYVSHLDFHLCCDFSALDYNGTMTTASLGVNYPLILSKAYKLSLSATVFDRWLRDESLGSEINDRNVRATQLSVAAAHSGRAETRAYITLTSANLDLSGNTANQTIDAASARTEGGFWKVRGQAQQRWPLFKSSWLNYQISGQWASRNLDPSEKFVLGGINGVRAYPVGEGAGDMGLLARAELGTLVPIDAPGRLGISIFVDAGTTWLNQTTWAGALGAGQSNHYALAGTGVAAIWALPHQVTAEMSVATKLGSNDGMITGLSEADGRNIRTRGWASLRWDF